MVRRCLRLAAWSVALAAAFLSAQRLLTPKYASGAIEGALIAEYYGDPKGNQVIFIGDCEAYENFSPIALWEEYGISSYIRGAPQQLMWQSLAVLEDTLRYETPEAVALSVLSMMYPTPQSEAYNRLNLDGLRPSPTKLRAVRASMTEGEDLLSYLFPILRYHDRWAELGAEDFANFWGAGRVGHSGYTLRCDIRPVDVVPVGRPLADYRFGPKAMDALERVAEICESRGIALILFKAPSIYPYWYPQWDAQIAEFAEARGLLYVNLLDRAGDIGIDFQTDTYDGGLHLNVYGAEKLSAYFGGILRERFGLKDMRGDEALRAAWDGKAAAYREMMRAQIEELEAYGEVRTLTYR